MEICEITLNAISICTIFTYPVLIVTGLFLAFMLYIKISEKVPAWWSRLNETQKINIKLILSGHTHGGQITFLGKAFYKPGGSGRFLRGWYRLNDIRMYVSKGIGTKYIQHNL